MGNQQHSSLTSPEGRDRPNLHAVGPVPDGASAPPPDSDTRPVAAKNPPVATTVSPAAGGPISKSPVPKSDALPSSGTFRSSLPCSVDGLIADLPRRRAPTAEQVARRARLQRIVLTVLAAFGLFDVAIVLWLISQ